MSEVEIERRIARARDLWDLYPSLRYAFCDLGAFLQTLPDLGQFRAAQHDEVERRCVDGAARLAFTRNPRFARAPGEFYERQGGRLTIWLYGEIGHGPLAAPAIVSLLRKHRGADAVVVRASSFGGIASHGEQIAYALIHFRGRTIGIVDHWAMSAAAHVICVCDTVIARSNSLLMLHRSRATSNGNADHYRQASDYMRMGDERMVRHVLTRRRCQHDAVLNAISDERYLGAVEAHQIGLCDRITRPLLGSDQIIEKEKFNA